MHHLLSLVALCCISVISLVSATPTADLALFARHTAQKPVECGGKLHLMDPG